MTIWANILLLATLLKIIPLMGKAKVNIFLLILEKYIALQILKYLKHLKKNNIVFLDLNA